MNGEHRGRVFGTDDGRGLEGVLVSDGHCVVRTDESGKYRIDDTGGRAKFLFVTTPSGYRSERFFHFLEDEREYDFPLEHWEASAGEHFYFIHISDTETSESGAWLEELREFIGRVTPQPAFLMHTGDLCHASGIIWHAKEVRFSTVGIPVFYAIGNHDYLLGDDVGRPPWMGYYPGLHYGEELFEQHLGPTYYSFDAGNIHFLVLPSLHSHDANPDTTFADLHEWLTNDLALVPCNKGLIALQHSPELGNYTIGTDGKTNLELASRNLRAVLAGHWHANQARRNAAGVLSLLTTTPKCGGIDHAPRSFRVVRIMGQEISVETRVGNVEKHLEVLPPWCQENGEVKVVARVYDTSRPTLDVCFTVHRHGKEGAWKQMRPTGAGWSWEGILQERQLNEDNSTVTVRATLAGDAVLERQCHFSLPTSLPRLDPTSNWPVYMRDAAHGGTADFSLEPPLRLAWVTDIGGHILHSSPVISDGRIFVAVADDEDAGRQGVTAIAGNTGKVLWHFTTRDSIKHSPATIDGLCFTVDLEGRLYALDAASGTLTWERELGLRGGAGVYEGVICESGTVYAGSGQGLTALTTDGILLWKNRHWHQTECCTAMPTLAQGILYASQNWGVGLMAHDAGTGELLWKVDDTRLRFRDSSPVVCGKILYLLSEPHLFVLHATSGEILGQKEIAGVKSTATPLIAKGRILIGTVDSGLVCLDLESLEEMWRFLPGKALTPTMPYAKEPSRGFEAAPTLAGNIVYIGGLDGVFYGLNLESGEERWHCNLGASLLAPAAISGNCIYTVDFAGSLCAFVAG